MNAATELKNGGLDLRERARQRGREERERLKERLINEGAADLAEKLQKCGQQMILICSNCGERRQVEIACKRRWCPACAWLVQRERIAKYGRAASAMQWPLFVTLTVPNTTDPECIRGLREAWGRMRRRKLMAERVAGGVSTIEITNKGNGWHPHLHCLCDCKWLAIHTPPPRPNESAAVIRQKCDFARQELSAVWADVIKNPVAVVLAIRKAPGEALAYALKYGVKGSDLIEAKNPIAPLIRVLSKSRMLSAFGSLHGLKLDEEEDERPAVICPCCGEEKTLVPQMVEDRARIQAYDRAHAIR